MSDQVAAAGRMVCPFCTAEPKGDWGTSDTPWFTCGTMIHRDRRSRADQTDQCVEAELKLVTSKLCDAVAEIASLKEQVTVLKAVAEDPHTLWTNWLRGTVKLPAGIGDIRQSEDRAKRFRERWLHSRSTFIHEQQRASRAEERVARLQDECRIAILRAERAEERVKRLEEAGDAMAVYEQGTTLGEAWAKAKGEL